MLTITAAQRRELRAEAHSLSPVVMIGDAGLTSAVIKEIETSLNAHGLIKVRVLGDDREERIAIYEGICRQLHAAPVQHIGKLLVLYRPKKEIVKTSDTPKGKGVREVTIAKQIAGSTKRPVKIRASVKGNQRVTKGGLIKRAKTRQASAKKAALKS